MKHKFGVFDMDDVDDVIKMEKMANDPAHIWDAGQDLHVGFTPMGDCRVFLHVKVDPEKQLQKPMDNNVVETHAEDPGGE